MAFIRRQNAAEESTADDLQNVNNAKRQLIEPSIAEYENYDPTENVNRSTNLYDDRTLIFTPIDGFTFLITQIVIVF